MKRNPLRKVIISGTGTLFFIGLLCSCRSESPDHGPPNILFIMADDHATQAISCYRGLFADAAATVNVDRIAAGGMQFTSAFCTNSICSPARATLLTGKYSHKNGIYLLGQTFDTSQVTSTRMLKNQGYQTAVFGKWHLGCLPPDFDDYKVLPVQGRYQDPEFHVKGTDSLVIYEGWSTDIIADMTMEYLKNRDPDKPFFVMCHFKATHDPWASRPPFDTLFSEQEIQAPANLLDTYDHRGPASKITRLKLEYMNQGTYPHHRLEGADALTQREYIYQQYIRSYLRCGRVLDENVGRLLDYLEKEGLDQNTVVIYTSDQGHFLGEHGFFSKRLMYEESMRIPLIIKYPGYVQPGTVSTELVANTDIAPTLLSLAGMAVPSDMQGTSLLPLLRGETPPGWRDAIYYRYWQHLLHREVIAHYGIRTATHKLIYFYGQPLGMTEFPPVEPSWELYNLENDPQEMHNLYPDSSHTRLVHDLKQKLLDLKEEFEDRDEEYPVLDSLNQIYFRL